MADVPFPIIPEDFPTLLTTLRELFRQIYEEKIGGADLGDVFSIENDTLSLDLATLSGLTKAGAKLSIDLDGTTLSIGANGIKVTQASSGWAVTNKTVDRTLNCNVGDVNVVADVLGTLIDDLVGHGIIGA